ncbi:hypothetical protein [Pseudoalteromonas sp. SR45-4]|uniref:hypothetical protein n=1 Tax=Pseudoalteromonas sp. SR45-4 TaxID=2760929 RepID=UPI0015FBA747|nr:hypothetical protein [Pseudoalteromonas sp. SR45-4]MBB1369424.1 hypothetical protein [Pseudoalteromonas sp. SR45-4]
MAKNNTYLYSPLDESLQSYLFRTLKVNGFDNFSSILVPNVGWGDKPSISFEAKHLLLKINKSYLLGLFENSIRVLENESDFINHFDFIALYEKTFFPVKPTKSAGKGISINFCPHCMKEQIVTYGYSYFKNCWNNQTFCSKHSATLLAIKPSHLSQLIKNINNVLRCKVDTNFTSPSTITKRPSKVISDRTIKFTPCAKSQLISWAIKTLKHYPIGYTDTFDYGLLTKKSLKAFNLIKHRQEIMLNWELFYQQLTVYAHQELINYINCNMIFDRALYQKDGIHSTSKVILKNKTKSCSTCMRFSFEEYKACPKNKLIFSSLVDDMPDVFEFLYFYNSPCTSKYYELKSEIEGHQNKLGIRTGEIEVKREVELSKHFKKYGGKEGFYENLQDIVMNITIV